MNELKEWFRLVLSDLVATDFFEGSFATAAQRTPEWFLLHSVCDAVWKVRGNMTGQCDCKVVLRTKEMNMFIFLFLFKIMSDFIILSRIWPFEKQLGLHFAKKSFGSDFLAAISSSPCATEHYTPTSAHTTTTHLSWSSSSNIYEWF